MTEHLPEAAAAVIAIKEFGPRLLGPSIDYLGLRLLDSVKAAENLARVFLRAKTKLGSRIEQPGSVSPRVVKGILEEGPFAEAGLVSEYLSGVLASARTDRPHDDRAVAVLACISRMSSLTLRAHFLFYRAMLESALASELTEEWSETHLLQVSFRSYADEMGLSIDLPNDDPPEPQLALLSAWGGHVYGVLEREDLVRFHRKGYELSEDKMYVSPTALGTELFAFALARPPERLFSEPLSDADADLPRMDDAKLVPRTVVEELAMKASAKAAVEAVEDLVAVRAFAAAHGLDPPRLIGDISPELRLAYINDGRGHAAQ